MQIDRSRHQVANFSRRQNIDQCLRIKPFFFIIWLVSSSREYRRAGKRDQQTRRTTTTTTTTTNTAATDRDTLTRVEWPTVVFIWSSLLCRCCRRRRPNLLGNEYFSHRFFSSFPCDFYQKLSSSVVPPPSADVLLLLLDIESRILDGIIIIM